MKTKIILAIVVCLGLCASVHGQSNGLRIDPAGGLIVFTHGFDGEIVSKSRCYAFLTRTAMHNYIAELEAANANSRFASRPYSYREVASCNGGMDSGSNSNGSSAECNYMSANYPACQSSGGTGSGNGMSSGSNVECNYMSANYPACQSSRPPNPQPNW